MKIDVFITPNFVESEALFQGSIVLMIDVLRASTSICSALFNGAREILPCETIEKAMQLYSSLAKETRLLAGEKNSLKPEGFDLGNSPAEFKKEVVEGKSIVFTSTNGSKTFLKAKSAKLKIVACFANLNTVFDYLRTPEIINEQSKIFILCAGNQGSASYEDTLCAGAFVHFLTKEHNDIELTDSAYMSKNLYNLHSFDLKNFLKTRDHAKHLSSLNLSEDLETAFQTDIFPVIPIVSEQTIRKLSLENN